MGAGASNTSALAYGGTDGSSYPAPDYHTGKTESWNGTAWTEVADLGTGRYGAGADGTATAAIAAGGTAAVAKVETETWNGSAWTESADINTGRSYLEAAGTTTDALAFGGNPATGKTESWDGSSWTETADMATARLHSGGAGASNQSALVFGGTAPPDSGLNATEEWSFPSAPGAQVGQVWFNTGGILKGFAAQGTGAWASGGNLNTPRTELAATVGIQTAAMAVGRSEPTPTDVVEQYDGTSWTEVAEISTDRGRGAGAATSYTAAIIFGGVTNPGDAAVDNTESWNGSAWTEVADLPAATSDTGGLGTQTSAFCVGGQPGGNESNAVSSWDGSSWTSGTAINTARTGLASSGSTTAGLAFGGRQIPTSNNAQTEEWDGSSWAEVADLNTARHVLGGFGVSSGSLAVGGTGPTANCESWNGTAWTEVANVSTAGTRESAAAGTGNVSGRAITGNATEEWDVPGVTKTLTVS